MSKYKWLGFWVVVVGILFINSVHNSYPDEFDNILGGHLILEGKLPYSGFFSHHGPLDYYLAAVLNFFSGQSFVHFRLLTVPFFTILLGIILGVSRRVKQARKSIFVKGFILLLTVSATYFWLHMFLADSISGFFLIGAYALLFLKLFYREGLNLGDVAIVSTLGALTILSSPTYQYAVGVLLIILMTACWESLRTKKLFVKALALIALPYLLFGIYLLISHSWKDFYFQAIIYNRDYYAFTYERPPGVPFNPVRYAVVIFTTFFNHYQDIIGTFNGINAANPLAEAFTLTNLTFLAFLLWTKRWRATILSLGLLVYSTLRSDPGSLKTTDYQIAVYVMLTFFNGCFLVEQLVTNLEEIKGKFGQFLFSALGVGVVFFWFLAAVVLVGNFWRLAYFRYMGWMPLIYDRPQVAPLVNMLVPREHYCWVGAFEFEEMFYLNCQLPSKYIWVLPQYKTIDKIHQEMIADLSEHRPDVIVYTRHAMAFMQPPDYHGFIVQLLDKNYVQIGNIAPGKKYRFKNPHEKNFNLDEDLNFRSDLGEEILAKLLAADLVERQ